MEFTFRQCALDVFALLDHLRIERFKAIGMSLGAKTLLHVATQQPARVEAMVLVSATPYFPEQARAIMRQVSADNRAEAEWQQIRQWHRHGDEQIRTLIVHGDRDPLYPVHLALEMHSAIPRSHLWVVPNGGHGPIFGSAAAQFQQTSLAFLRGEWKAA